ncbi:iron-containing alcohol dehydrogenase [Clostridium sp. DL1XJH146]
MENFIYSNSTKIIFGKDVETSVGEYTKAYGKKVLLHYGGGSIKRTGLYKKIVQSFKEAAIEFVELGGVKPNPRLSLVKEGIDLCREEKVDFILAVGGGSVIDSAKSISAGVLYDGDVWDFYSRKASIEKSLPIGVVLTIPAAGSETSGGTVILNEDGMLKAATNHISLRPEFALLNPEITYTLPPYQTACGVVDMLAHVMERYFTNTKNVELTDRLCEATMKTIINQGPKVIENPNDYNARAEIMYSGTVAHNSSLEMGRETDWASHMIEHELSGIYDIPHGAGLSIVFPAWMKFNCNENKEFFAKFAHRVFNIEYNFDDIEETALKGIKALEDFYVSIGMPIRLKDAGIEDNRFEEMAAKATGNNSFTLGNFKKVNKEDIIKIYELCV